MQCVHTNLMCAPGDRTGFDQRGSLKPLLHFKACFRWLAFRADFHHALAALENIFQQRCLYHFY